MGVLCLSLGGWLLFQSRGGPAISAALAGTMTAGSLLIAQVFTLAPQVLGVWPVAFAFGAFLAGFGLLVLVGATKRDRALRLGDEALEWETLFGRRLRVPLREIVAVEPNGAGDHMVILCPPDRRVIPADWFTPESGGLMGAVKTVAAHVDAHRPKKRAR